MVSLLEADEAFQARPWCGVNAWQAVRRDKTEGWNRMERAGGLGRTKKRLEEGGRGRKERGERTKGSGEGQVSYSGSTGEAGWAVH